jgi:hypothetical protein
MTTVFKIQPAIGIARVGDGDQFFVGPERQGHPGVEIAADSSESTLKTYKSGGRIKRQAARFRVFEYKREDDGTLTLIGEVQNPAATVEWTVTLVNSKAAGNSIIPFNDETRRVLLPNGSPRNPSITDRDSLVIQGGTRKISGINQGPFQFDDGSFLGDPVYLGEVLTDSLGRLIVLGGRGVSRGIPMVQGGAIPPLNSFANNDRWYDDVSDGPVTARVTIPGQQPIDAIPAWLVCAPPDFAPAAGSPVTMYDIVTQAAIMRGWITSPQMPSFRTHILPILQRSRSLQWVDDWAEWSAISDDWAALSRHDNHTGRLLAFEQITNASLHEYKLPQYLLNILIAWRDGNFVDDYTSQDIPTTESQLLDEAALHCCVGTSFYPGIEAGFLWANPNLYMEYGRFSHLQVKAGQLTGQMALPWQADFNDCSDDWWPSQRPTNIFVSSGDVPNSPVRWADGVSSSTSASNRRKMVENFSKLGFVVSDGVGSLIEAERDTNLPPH